MALMFRVVSAVNVGLFRMTGGRLGGSMRGNQIVLLTTIGNKSGQPRTVPVMAFEDGGDRIVIASKGGSPEHPAWYKNLSKTPEVTVEVRGRKYRARAQDIAGAERARIWTMVVAKMPQFGRYEQKTAGRREIPVVRLREIQS